MTPLKGGRRMMLPMRSAGTCPTCRTSDTSPSRSFIISSASQRGIGDAPPRPLGFGTAQLPVLTGLRDGRAHSQAELVKSAGIEQQSMAELLARMERDGIIRREPDPDDRRRSLVTLTGEARAKIPAGRAILQQSNTELTEGLSAAEVQNLNAQLHRILTN